MEEKVFTQPGKFSVSVMLPLFIFTVVMMIISGTDDLILLTILGFVSLILLFCLLIFYKITITINESTLSFSLGIGLIKKTFRIDDIKSCKVVTNPAWYGIGIRLLPDGWLYNVSGLKAVELTFKNKKSKIRIGTDKPDEIAAIVNKLTGEEIPEGISEDTGKSSYYVFGAVIFILLLFPAVLIFRGNRETDVILNDSGFIIKGMYGTAINYSDIAELDTLSAVPSIRLRTNGYALGKTLKGNFRLINQEHARLFIKKGSPPFIYIKTDKIKLYLNFQDPEKTLQLYNGLKTRHVTEKR